MSQSQVESSSSATFARSLRLILCGGCITCALALAVASVALGAGAGALALSGMPFASQPAFVLHRIAYLANTLAVDDQGAPLSGGMVASSVGIAPLGAAVHVRPSREGDPVPVWVKWSLERTRGVRRGGAAGRPGVHASRLEFARTYKRRKHTVQPRGATSSSACSSATALLTVDATAELDCTGNVTNASVVFALASLPPLWRWCSAKAEPDRDPVQWTWSLSETGPNGPWVAISEHRQRPVPRKRSQCTRWTRLDERSRAARKRSDAFHGGRPATHRAAVAAKEARGGGVPLTHRVWLVTYGFPKSAAELTSKRLFACASRMTQLLGGFTPVTLPMWRGNSAWELVRRHEVLAEFLAQGKADGSIAPGDLVWVIDGFDTLIARRPTSRHSVVRKFIAATSGDRNGVLFNGACACFPQSDVCALMSTAASAMGAHTHSPFKYLNGGGMMGRASTVETFIDTLLELTKKKKRYPSGGDLLAIQELCFRPRMAKHRGAVTCHIDTGNVLMEVMFPTTYSGKHVDATCKLPRFKRPWAANTSAAVLAAKKHFPNWIMRPDEDVRLCNGDKQGTMCLTDPATHGQPIVLHFQGTSAQTTHGRELLHTQQLGAFLAAAPLNVSKAQYMAKTVVFVEAANKKSSWRWRHHKYGEFAKKPEPDQAKTGGKKKGEKKKKKKKKASSALALKTRLMKYSELCGALKGDGSAAQTLAIKLGIIASAHE